MSMYKSSNTSRTPVVIAKCMIIALATFIAICGSRAPAANAQPELKLHVEVPDSVRPADAGDIPVRVAIQNVGDLATNADVVVTDAVSAGLTAPTDYTASGGFRVSDENQLTGIAQGSTTISCSPLSAAALSCTISGTILPGAVAQFSLNPTVDPAAVGDLVNTVSIQGGGSGPLADVVDHIRVGPPSPFGISAFEPSLVGPTGAPFSRAGGVPAEFTTHLAFPTDTGNFVGLVRTDHAVEQFKDIATDLPAGLIGLPQATAARCTTAQLATSPDPNDVPSGSGLFNACPLESQIGYVRLTITDPAGNVEFVWIPLYNLVPAHGTPALLGFTFEQVVVVLAARVRDDDRGIEITARNAPTTLPVLGVDVTVWGVPSDTSHDGYRASCLQPADGPGPTGAACHSDAPRTSFLRLPTRCDGPIQFGVAATTYVHPDRPSFASAAAPPLRECERVPFQPAMEISSTTTAVDAPTGLDVKLSFPQDSNPDAPQQADLRSAQLTLPAGMTINAASAHGLASCDDDDLRFGRAGAASCPDASKIGTVSVDTPLLERPVPGSIFVRRQASSDPESGDLFRIAIELRDDERGVDVKLPGSVRADAQTGQLTATFDNTPQLPFSVFNLHFKAGSTAPLATSTTCGAQTAHARLTSWTGAVREQDPSFTLACSGVPGFSPTFQAGATNPIAGAFSPFTLNVTRPDGQQDLTGLKLSLPAGVTAKLAGVARCGEGDAAAGTCSEASRVGTTTVLAGAGSTPYPLKGGVFLTGPYNGAPFGLAVAVPAVAGPYDLGTVVVRQALFVDPLDAHVTVVSDPVPTIVKGVPVRLQRLDVDVDRPGFMINPTSCAAKSIDGVLDSIGGATATVSVRFQVSDCASLGLKPDLGLTLSGKGQTTDGKHPAVTAVLKQPIGDQANLKKVVVKLPLSLALDTENADGLCEFVDGSKIEPTCPKNSIVGTATATTPILDEPLTGPVYFVKNVRKDAKSGREIRTLPKLVIPLVGQNGVKLTLTGTSDVVDDQLVTTFDKIPDAPVSNFKLNIIGGKGGILVVSGTDICKATQIADQQIDGQNNKAADASVFIQTPSCPTKIISKKITAKTVTLKVGGLGAGKVTVIGRGIKKTTKAIAKSTVARITTRRTKGRLGKVKVSFVPAGTKKARTITATLR